jgi:hypothetical protein
MADDIGTMEEWIAEGNDTSDGSRPNFYTKAVYHKYQSDIENRPVYKDTEYVKIFCPGEVKNIPDRKVQEADKLRWPREYAAFKAQESQEFGIPLKNLPNISPSRIAMMQGLNIHSIEQLAGLTDSGVEAIGPGGLDLRKMAAAYLESNDDRDTRLAEENADLKRKMADMESKLNQLVAAQGEANKKAAEAVKEPNLDDPPFMPPMEAGRVVEGTTSADMPTLPTGEQPQEPPKKRGRPRKNA